MSENLSEEKHEVLEERNNENSITLEPSNEEQVKKQVKQVVAEVTQSEFSGPIPPPSIIKGYEEVLPGAADRIITMAEIQSKHRQDMERKMIHAELRDSLLGILFAFVLGVGCIVAAIIIVICVPENAGAIAGALVGVTGIGSIIATFIKSTRGTFGKQDDEVEK